MIRGHGLEDIVRHVARHLAKRGHHVSIANSRGPESLTALAAEIGATPVSVVDAAHAGDTVIIAIPTKAAELPAALFAHAPSGVVVIDTGNYHPELRDGRIDPIDRGMLDSQCVAQQIGRPVIKRSTGYARIAWKLVAAHHRYRVGDFDRGVLTLHRLSGCRSEVPGQAGRPE